MSYISRFSTPPPPQLSGFFGDAWGLIKEGSNAILDPVMQYVPGTPAWDMRTASVEAKAAMAKDEMRRMQDAAHNLEVIQAEHGGYAIPPPLTEEQRTGVAANLVYLDEKEKEQRRKNLVTLGAVGVLGAGAYFLLRKKR